LAEGADAATLAADLVACRDDDLRTRAALVASGELFASGYHPRMRAVHERNADRLDAVIARIGGWPTAALVGEEAAEAAWLVAQHAIGRPAFFRRCAALVEQAAAAGAAPCAQAAMMADRIRALEGRRQLYGTQFDWDEGGELSPHPIEDAARVDERRAAAGLNTLAERQAELRAQAVREGDAPPADGATRRAELERWAKETGWR
jgi:hypothetical protein